MLNFKNVKILKTHNTLHITVQSHLTFYCNKKDSFDSLINTGLPDFTIWSMEI